METPQGQVVSVDAKIGFDDNAKFRQQEIFNMEDTTESDPREVEANKYNLNYIGMDGNIGCLGEKIVYYLFIRFLKYNLKLFHSERSGSCNGHYGHH